jgi:hypothetical protein
MSRPHHTILVTINGITHQTNYYPDKIEMLTIRTVEDREHPLGWRLCTKCDEYKPQDKYGRSVRDGIRAQCKDCANDNRNIWRRQIWRRQKAAKAQGNAREAGE